MNKFQGSVLGKNSSLCTHRLTQSGFFLCRKFVLTGPNRHVLQKSTNYYSTIQNHNLPLFVTNFRITGKMYIFRDNFQLRLFVCFQVVLEFYILHSQQNVITLPYIKSILILISFFMSTFTLNLKKKRGKQNISVTRR